MIVSYDTKKNSWHCPCTKTKRSCPHKYIAKWHLFQTHRSLFRKVRSTDVEECLDTALSTADENPKEDDVGDVSYPPEDYQKMKRMVQYILKFKTIPAVLPEHLLHPVDKEHRKHLIPEEMLCQHCPGKVPLSDPVLVTNKAKILTNTNIE